MRNFLRHIFLISLEKFGFREKSGKFFRAAVNFVQMA
jgi:hypothetical protein